MHHAVRLAGIMALATVMACAQTSGTAQGVVTSVEGSLEEVTAFSILVAGEEWRFLSVTDGDYGFALPHLREHLLTGDPVLVGWELVDNVRYALSLADG
ncbi:MAG TPA: hypothetical protein VI980_08355 [Acidimicrobiia bacterium]|nr:hypothetical protein [Acidimicrobiia bacterium]